MKQIKKIMMGLMIMVAMAFPTLAGNFQIQNATGLDYLILDSTTGDFNITTGKIAEQGTLLEDIYCAIAGCTATGTWDFTGSTVDFANDAINESDISFSTLCTGTEVLRVNDTTNDLYCTDSLFQNSLWDISTSLYLYNNSGILDVNASAIVDNLGLLNQTQIEAYNGTWNAAQLDGQDASFYRDLWGLDEIYITNVSDVATLNETKLNSTIATYLSSDGYVEKGGSNMTGDLNMTDGADITLATGSVIANPDKTTNMTIDTNGNFIITLAP